MPEERELRRFYDGFLFQADLRNLECYTTPEIESWLRSFAFPSGARMLDVGGGGGFMARAFESFGLGRSWYVDLDPKACGFARESLGLTEVLNEDVCGLPSRLSQRFDFIYCRHVLEHVPDPIRMIQAMMELLAEGGVLEMILPNGISLEYLGYPSLLHARVNRLLRGNLGWSRARVWGTFATSRIAHGMDPIRHLWAITEKALSAWTTRQVGFETTILTASLSDPIYSMYHARRLASTWSNRLHTRLVVQTLGRLRGGCHLILRMRRLRLEGTP
jgi:SAM-dependent methyltransferase